MKKVNTCNILGVNISCINMNMTLDFIDKNIENIHGKYICVSNVHTTVMSYENNEYRNIQNSAMLTLPDGKPLSIVAKKRGHKDIDRVTGPDFMENILKNSNEKGYRHFFYGSTSETLQKLKENLNKKYPYLQIVGMYSPPFRELTNKEDEKIVEMINKSNADFVWVGLGAPKQEKWMYMHKNKINSLMVGVGAAFDYFAGNIKRAPKWMQKSSLEWLYRLIQDPKRLWKRYIYTNFKFIWYVYIKKK